MDKFLWIIQLLTNYYRRSAIIYLSYSFRSVDTLSSFKWGSWTIVIRYLAVNKVPSHNVKGKGTVTARAISLTYSIVQALNSWHIAYIGVRYITSHNPNWKWWSLVDEMARSQRPPVVRFYFASHRIKGMEFGNEIVFWLRDFGFLSLFIRWWQATLCHLWKPSAIIL